MLRTCDAAVLSLTWGQSVNPGLMKTELQRHSPKIQGVIMVRLDASSALAPITNCSFSRVCSSSHQCLAPILSSSLLSPQKSRTSTMAASSSHGVASVIFPTTSGKGSSQRVKAAQERRRHSGDGVNRRQRRIGEGGTGTVGVLQGGGTLKVV